MKLFNEFCLLVIFLLMFARGQNENETEEVLTRVGPYAMDIKTTISGLRIVNTGKQDGFIAYTDSGVSIVHPDVEVRVNIFGYHLEKITMIALTTENCFSSVFNITRNFFQMQNLKRLEFLASFPESEEEYKICYNERIVFGGSSEEDDDMIMIDDMRTWVSTEITQEQDEILPLHIRIMFVLVLFCLSALMSGLNLGLIALSPQELELIIQSGSKKERRYAKAIIPVRKKANYLLCTILITNVVVNAAIAILLEDIYHGVVAFIVSSAGIVIIGEIIPQSICIKKGLAVGANTVWLTRFFMILTFPLSYPISLALDKILGESMPVYDRNKLIHLMKMAIDEEDHELHGDLKIAVGGMEIYQKTVGEILTKIEDVFMLSEDTILNAANIGEIVRHGYTRIPVYRGEKRDNIVALLMVKDLALIDPDDNFAVKTVCEYHHYPLRFVDEGEHLHTLLEEFKEGNYHMAIVERYCEKTKSVLYLNEPPRELLGIVTLEDIVEEILQAEIVDETDIITDNLYRSNRKDKKEPDIARMLSCESCYKELPVQMETQITRFLKEQHVLFTDVFIEQRALSILLKKNAKKVGLPRTPRIDGISKQTKGINLYTAGVPSQRFILIIEGRAIAEICDMKFDVGPWNCFGIEVLEQVKVLLKADLFKGQSNYLISPSSAVVSCIKFVPDFTLRVTETCRFLQITAPSLINACQVTKVARDARNGRWLKPLWPAGHVANDTIRFRGFSDTQIPQMIGITELQDSANDDQTLTEKKRCESDYGRDRLFVYKVS